MQKVEGLARGDRVITKQALFDTSDHRLGMLFPDCVNVGSAARVFNATPAVHLDIPLRQRPTGERGRRELDAGVRAGFPIVGGSGAYRAARGQITPGAPVKGCQGVDVLHLDG